MKYILTAIVVAPFKPFRLSIPTGAFAALVETRLGNAPPKDAPNPFGDGYASRSIVEFLQARLG